MYAAPFWAFLLLTVTLVKSEGNIGKLHNFINNISAIVLAIETCLFKSLCDMSHIIHDRNIYSKKMFTNFIKNFKSIDEFEKHKIVNLLYLQY